MRTRANSHEKAKIDWHCLKCLILSQRCRTKFHAFETVETGEPRIDSEKVLSALHVTSLQVMIKT